jgi:hypothetical protein
MKNFNTMNKLVLIALGLVLSFNLFSQKLKTLKVSFEKIQDVNWPLNMSLPEAEEKNLVEYPTYGVGHNELNFDLVNNEFTISYNDVTIKFKIFKYQKNQFGHSIQILDETGLPSTKYLITEKLDSSKILVVQYKVYENQEKNIGYFSNDIKLEEKF